MEALNLEVEQARISQSEKKVEAQKARQDAKKAEEARKQAEIEKIKHLAEISDPRLCLQVLKKQFSTLELSHLP